AHGALSQEAKANADKALSELNADRQKLNALETRLGEAERAFAALPTSGSQTGGKSLGETVVANENVQQFM
ncbi:hypothetical protein QG055_10275, partial [Kingella kingae]